VDCWTSRFSLWAAKPLAPSLATQVPLSVSKARTLSSGVTSTRSRRPVWRCLELISLADYKGLGLPQLTPKN
jgi:hypothetical protein